MNRKIIVQRWDQIGQGKLTEAAIQKVYTPRENYRISFFHYPAGTKFSGAMRQSYCYVIQGSCECQFDVPIRLSAGQMTQLPEGRYKMQVLGSGELHLVLVWDPTLTVPRTFSSRCGGGVTYRSRG